LKALGMMLWLRSLLFNIYLYTMTALVAVGGAPAMLISERAALRVMRAWSLLVNFGLRRICNIRIEIRGQENLPVGRPALIACKHHSMWDTIIFLSLLPKPVYILKKELGLIPFFGWYTIRTGMVRVDREGHASALKKMIADSKRCIADGKTLVIFPEGTRAPVGEKLQYKPGIAALYHQLGVGCVPAALNSGLFWPRRKFLRTPGTIVLEFLPPIAPGLNRRDFMATLEERIEVATGRLLADA
jgi:1-acyl-sn-glycerol-3-phosphate acyltransferase